MLALVLSVVGQRSLEKLGTWAISRLTDHYRFLGFEELTSNLEAFRALWSINRMLYYY
jgi:hypothetical protein